MPKIVIVEKEKCNPEGCGGFLCTRVSPSNRAGKEAFYKDEDGKVGVNEELVSDIDRIAVNKCPFQALKLINLPSELTEAPIHRYGKNGFALYRLPVPIMGKVVGLLGRNGIGKSTAVKILAGILQPNLGRERNGEENKAPYDELIERFKGSEAQGYFEKLRDGKIVLSYKPQQVEHIPKAFKGSVRELLGKANEKGDAEFKRVTEVLQLANILERDIGVISGGELQRVAIAATVLKKANVYFFDEPTSYLDIKQRISVAHFLRSLADEHTAVMVIDHDLIILDYMTELIHIMYGQEGGYGIVSQPKSTKAGINVYLEGYLREENVRFRDQKVQFSVHAHDARPSDEQLVTWPAIEKQLGNFTLTASEGRIDKHDVIGVLGENGIGKTSFVKTLARIEAETKAGALKVSYKPQYLEEADCFSAEKTVGEVLQHALAYEHQLIAPLALQPLFEKTLGQLSGGELQRVIIAAKLAEEADLYLLDEPSAYLDVEQRLLMSKITREMMAAKGKACLVVDHDILFIDYLSEKLIVFEGEPGKRGVARGPFSMSEGMNRFLKGLNITFRRDEESHRPRVNKEGSVKDREQKASGKLYYAS
ncbi:ribosome biogenesis/translation initiation ATPase RLI [Candidatus Woesearchaeota archaeon]|nr:MAG: ribosome biogenesis/translation initiation ATPase RLI [Candidatus Woesearchaeota archaeon]